jgi:hypothetical protein
VVRLLEGIQVAADVSSLLRAFVTKLASTLSSGFSLGDLILLPNTSVATSMPSTSRRTSGEYSMLTLWTKDASAYC